MGLPGVKQDFVTKPWLGLASVEEAGSLRNQKVKQQLPKGKFLSSAWYLGSEPNMGGSVSADL